MYMSLDRRTFESKMKSEIKKNTQQNNEEWKEKTSSEKQKHTIDLVWFVKVNFALFIWLISSELKTGQHTWKRDKREKKNETTAKLKTENCNKKTTSNQWCVQ